MPPDPATLPTALYDADVLEWSERQATLLRQFADGTPANEKPDWSNIAEEVESVGRSELHAVESLLTNALLHDLKCEAWPYSRNVPHWQAEARTFRRQARRRLSPSMRNRIDPAGLFADALAGLPTAMDGRSAGPHRTTPPASLAEAFGEDA